MTQSLSVVLNCFEFVFYTIQPYIFCSSLGVLYCMFIIEFERAYLFSGVMKLVTLVAVICDMLSVWCKIMFFMMF